MYDVIIGQRRTLACKELNYEYIPALITDVNDKTSLILKSFSEIISIDLTLVIEIK